MLRPEAGWNPFSGPGLPLAIESRADLPNATADADEHAIMEVDFCVAWDDVDTKVGVEPKLRAAMVLVAVPVCRSMRRRAWLMDYDGRPAMVRRQDNPVAAPDRDDDHQCGKKLCETKHGRYLQ